jgi:quinol monooxygenase YgiN
VAVNDRGASVIIGIGDVYAQIPRREEVRELMRSTQVRIREQPGCIGYEFAESLDEPGHFIVIQQWRDEAALEEHYRSATFAQYQTAITDQIVRASELRLYTVQGGLRPVEASPSDPRLDD